MRRHPQRARPRSRPRPARRWSREARCQRRRAKATRRRRRTRHAAGAPPDGRADERARRRGGAFADADAEDARVTRPDGRGGHTPAEDDRLRLVRSPGPHVKGTRAVRRSSRRVRGTPGKPRFGADAAAADEPRGLAHGRHRRGRVPGGGHPEATGGLEKRKGKTSLRRRGLGRVRDGRRRGKRGRRRRRVGEVGARGRVRVAPAQGPHRARGQISPGSEPHRHQRRADAGDGDTDGDVLVADAGRHGRLRHGTFLHPVLLHHRSVQRGGVRVRQHVRQGEAADDQGERQGDVPSAAVFRSQDCFGHRQHAGHAVPVRDGDVLVRGSEANGGGVLRVHNSLRAVHTGGAVPGIGPVVRHSGCPGVPHRGADGDSHADDFGRLLRDVQQHAGVHTLAELVLAGQVRVHRDGGQRVQRPNLSVRSER
mmetsp:Transcript_4522/g.18595  ORF Transcript_4522/g.18595 Transcript_4522/m.18595 type:complete len:425 (+) Transcript_4522:442-1716(+)